MRRIATALAILGVSLSIMLASVSAASARENPPDRINAARHGILGHTTKNSHTHIWTTIVGTYPYKRWVHVKGVGWRTKTFYNQVVSAQHCKPSHCWGKVIGGKLRSPYQPGRAKVAGHKPVDIEGAQNYCMNSLQCAAVWNWPTKYISDFDRHVASDVARPCVGGALSGVGIKVAHNAAGAAMADGAAEATAKKAAGIFGPEGYGTLALAGCFVGIGKHATNSIKAIASSLNPFNRSTPRRTR